MTVPNAREIDHLLPADMPASSGGGQTLPVALPNYEAMLIYYRGLDFKQMLAAGPVDGLDLERSPEPLRPVAL